MIYLIDDKKKRQEKDYNWTNELFEEYKKDIRPIYNLSELNTLKDDVLKSGDVILYHESFLDGTTQKDKAKDFRERMEQKAEKDNFSVAFFSGSKSSRSLADNVAHLPVSVVYQNLESFLNNENKALEYLLFGDNPEMEKNLSNLQEKALDITDEENKTEVEGNHLFFKPEENWFKNAISNCTEKDLFDSDISDEGFSQIINDTLSQEKYDNIFIPLCFGGVLSDFNGLQLATHIRCTKTTNQLSNIYIYGFADYSYLLENEYFNILKTKNVDLIDFSKKAVADAAKKKTTELKAEELPTEMEKLKLDVPKNYFDNHSVANEWGVYQMARNGSVNIKDIEGFDFNKLNTLYLKWLISKNDLQAELPEEQQKEQKEYARRLEGITVIGKIDLSKFKK